MTIMAFFVVVILGKKQRELLIELEERDSVDRCESETKHCESLEGPQNARCVQNPNKHGAMYICATYEQIQAWIAAGKFISVFFFLFLFFVFCRA